MKDIKIEIEHNINQDYNTVNDGCTTQKFYIGNCRRVRAELAILAFTTAA